MIGANIGSKILSIAAIGEGPTARALPNLKTGLLPGGFRESFLGRGLRAIGSELRTAWHLSRFFMSAAVDESGILRKMADQEKQRRAGNSR